MNQYNLDSVYLLNTKDKPCCDTLRIPHIVPCIFMYIHDRYSIWFAGRPHSVSSRSGYLKHLFRFVIPTIAPLLVA